MHVRMIELPRVLRFLNSVDGKKQRTEPKRKARLEKLKKSTGKKTKKGSQKRRSRTGSLEANQKKR